MCVPCSCVSTSAGIDLQHDNSAQTGSAQPSIVRSGRRRLCLVVETTQQSRSCCASATAITTYSGAQARQHRTYLGWSAETHENGSAATQQHRCCQGQPRCGDFHHELVQRRSQDGSNGLAAPSVRTGRNQHATGGSQLRFSSVPVAAYPLFARHLSLCLSCCLSLPRSHRSSLTVTPNPNPSIQSVNEPCVCLTREL